MSQARNSRHAKPGSQQPATQHRGSQPQSPATQQRQQAPEHDARPHHLQALVQGLMAVGVMNEDTCKAMLCQVLGLAGTHVQTMDKVFASALTKQNKEMEFTGLRIRTIKNPVDGCSYVGLVNTVADVPSKCASHYTILQRDFFKSVVEHIAVSTHNSKGPGTPCESERVLLNMELHAPPSTQLTPGSPAAAKRISLPDKAHTLRQLVADGWLTGSADQPGWYCFGPRTLLELGQYMLRLELPQATRDVWQDLV